MEALTPDVLKEGLRIQQALLPGAICQPSASEGFLGENAAMFDHGDSAPGLPAMFFHSPLLYWNCSVARVENDRRILKTVNDNIFQRSSAGITMRWGSVFAGKQFSHQKLIAADALVISLFYHLNSSAGELWDRRAEKIAREARQHGRFKVYPANGKEDYNLLYEVRFLARKSNGWKEKKKETWAPGVDVPISFDSNRCRFSTSSLSPPAICVLQYT